MQRETPVAVAFVRAPQCDQAPVAGRDGDTNLTQLVGLDARPPRRHRRAHRPEVQTESVEGVGGRHGYPISFAASRYQAARYGGT